MAGNNCFGDRRYLKDVLPLKTPYVAQFYLTNRCNFKCEFCNPEGENRSVKNDMDLDLYKNCIDSFLDFPEKVKVIWLAGQGEPLLHKNIIEMVEYARSVDVAENINIITNASLLNKKMSKALIEAGLSVLRVSVNGLSNQEYANHTGVKICFEDFIENIAFFYESCKGSNTKIYVKILDYMIDDFQKKEKFYKVFNDISHEIAVEHLMPIDENINYRKFAPDSKFDKSKMNEVLEKSKICSLPFYSIQIDTSGEILPCCAPVSPLIIGNVFQENLCSIWSGKQFNKFRIDMLNGTENSIYDVCRKCKTYLYSMHKEDVLDNVVNQLKEKYVEVGI